jgi:hypothetical protein
MTSARARPKAPYDAVRILRVDPQAAVHLVLPLPFEPGDRVIVQLHVEGDGNALIRIRRMDPKLLEEIAGGAGLGVQVS